MPKYKISTLGILIFWLSAFQSHAQAIDAERSFSRYDSLKGSLNPARSAYDVTAYHLQIRIEPEQQKILGFNTIYFNSLEKADSLQIDLHENFNVLGLSLEGKWLRFRRDKGHIFAYTDDYISPGRSYSLEVHYEGKPPVAKHAPWDGGFVWTRDSLGNPWAAVACEGIGASSWWPCKDYLGDEPDSMNMSISVPAGLMCVSNGQFLSVKPAEPGYNRFDWKVSYPINPYNVTVNIGRYEHWREFYESEGEKLALDYYVLPYNLEKAKEHFKQVKPMLACFEKYFGPYPFPRDGYALVETPYWGMEHQSAVAYGNNYKNNEFGFDFIIIHESGHEWWGNNLSCSDPAEMWLHESFTTYSETLYMECKKGKEQALKYIKSQRGFIRNEEPMIGPSGVDYHNRPDNDIYYKGAWMLHTLRSVIDNDSLFLHILLSFQQKYRHRNITTQDFVSHVNKLTGTDYTTFFNEYLRHAAAPRLVFGAVKKGRNTIISYRWEASEPGFNMPVDILMPDGKKQRIHPTTGQMQELKIKKVQPGDIRLDTDHFYFIPAGTGGD